MTTRDTADTVAAAGMVDTRDLAIPLLAVAILASLVVSGIVLWNTLKPALFGAWYVMTATNVQHGPMSRKAALRKARWGGHEAVYVPGRFSRRSPQ